MFSNFFHKSSIFCLPQSLSFPFPVYARRVFWIVKFLEALNRGYSNPTHPLGHLPPLSILCHPNITPSIAIVSTTDVHNQIHVFGISDFTSVLSQEANYSINNQTSVSWNRLKIWIYAGSAWKLGISFTVRLFLTLALPPFLGPSNPHPTFSHMALSLTAGPLQRDLCLTWLWRCQQQQYSPCLCVSRYSRGHGCLCTATGHHSMI